MIRRVAACCLLVLGTLATGRTTAADLAFVWLKDGRLLAGEIDPRTNDQRLWLRSSGAAFVMATSVAWDNIEAAKLGAKQMQSSTLKAHLEEHPPQHEPTPSPEPAEAAAGVLHLARPILPRHAASRVESISVEAHIANWDRDAEDDGIALRVYPRNALGEAVPVSGQLIVELVARNRLPVHNPDAFPRLGHWSIPVRAEDFEERHGVYRLPYRQPRDAKDLTLERHGLVKAALLVFGQGRFEAEATTYLQRFNPVRDDLLRQRNYRHW